MPVGRLQARKDRAGKAVRRNHSQGNRTLQGQDRSHRQGQSHRNIAGVSDGETTIIEKQLNIDRFLQEILLAIQKWSTTKKAQQLSLDFEIISGLFSTTNLNGSQVFCNCD